MEDDIIIRSDCRDSGFAFAAVFDGHVGFSSVKFLRYLPDTIDVGGSSQPRSTGCEHEEVSCSFGGPCVLPQDIALSRDMYLLQI
ncbi:hypothetical protein OROGR_008443 [Orobanche gracilis]